MFNDCKALTVYFLPEDNFANCKLHETNIYNSLKIYRSSGSNFLVSGGPSKTWIVGSSLVTITTSRLGNDLNESCKTCAIHYPKESPNKLSNFNDRKAARTNDDMSLVCSCWRSGWAEIKIRRPSGNTGWMMQLQNQPRPLSLTHPSSHGLRESDLGLLAVNIPHERLDVLSEACHKDKDPAQEEKSLNEDMFLSREVGSFTDISFLSSVEKDMADQVEKPVSQQGGVEANVDTNNSPVKVVVSGLTEDHMRGDLGTLDEGAVAVPAKGEKALGDNQDVSIVESAISQETVQDCKDTSVGEREKIIDSTPGLLDINEAAGVVGGDVQSEEEASLKRRLSVDKGKTTPLPISVLSFEGHSVSVIPPHVTRQANSQSWSETNETSPLPISPRASSYSFNMEHLPPLLSYDGGEDFSCSPSLHKGGEIMSEEEQVEYILQCFPHFVYLNFFSFSNPADSLC